MKKAFAFVMFAVFLAGCASGYERSADMEAAPILQDLQQKVDNERPPQTPPGVITPKPEGAVLAPVEATETVQAARLITLKEALALAFSTSRDYKSQKESLYLSALGFTLTRHQYEWVPRASVSGSIAQSANGGNGEITSADADATLSLARRLLSGGTFTLTGALAQNGTVAGEGGDSNSSNVSASFSQPLLAGAGLAAREHLFQAQRSLLYEARSFEIFREGLTIETINRYYDLLRRRRSIEAAKATVARFDFLYQKAEAQFEKGNLEKVEVFRAEQEKLSAQNSLNDDREAYNLALDRFKIELGFATDYAVDVAEEPIEPEIISVDLEKAVGTALANRLDLLTARQGLQDSERALEIARNALLPMLNFTANAGAASEPGQSLLDLEPNRTGTASAGLTLEIPLDKKAERNSYKSAIISLARQRRAYNLAEDNVKLNVRETVRNLRQGEFSLAIQKKNFELAQQRVEAANILFEKGQRSTRDVVEAQTALQDAQNAYVQAKVSYLIACIQLRKDIGTLRVDEKGQWF